jgi:hypothetical protein
MNDNDLGPRPTRFRELWNKGKLVGPKPPLRLSGRYGGSCSSKGERAISPCSILRSTAKLRGCDVVAARVDDVAPIGYTGPCDGPAE